MKITRHTRTLGWACSDGSEPTAPSVVGTVAQVLDERAAVLAERRARLGPDASRYPPRREVLWLGGDRLGRLGTLDLLQLCRLVDGGPDPCDTLALRSPMRLA